MPLVDLPENAELLQQGSGFAEGGRSTGLIDLPANAAPVKYSWAGTDTPVPVTPEMGDTARGFHTVWPQTKAMLGGVTALAGRTIGSDSLKDYGLEVYNRNMADSAQFSKPTDDIVNAWDDFKQNHNIGTLIDTAQYWGGYGGAQALQSIGSALVGGAIGSAVGPAGSIAGAAEGAVSPAIVKGLLAKAIEKEAAQMVEAQAAKGLTLDAARQIAAKNINKEIGVNAALFAHEATQELGSIYPEAEQQAGGQLDNAGVAKVWGAGIIAATVGAAADRLGLDQVFGAHAATNGVKGFLTNTAKQVAIGMGREAGEEGVQTGLERVGANQSLTDSSAVHDYLTSMFAGAVGGAQGGVVAGGKHALFGSPDVAPQVTPEQKIGEIFNQPDVDSAIAAAHDAVNSFQSFNPVTPQAQAANLRAEQLATDETPGPESTFDPATARHWVLNTPVQQVVDGMLSTSTDQQKQVISALPEAAQNILAEKLNAALESAEPKELLAWHKAGNEAATEEITRRNATSNTTIPVEARNATDQVGQPESLQPQRSGGDQTGQGAGQASGGDSLLSPAQSLAPEALSAASDEQLGALANHPDTVIKSAATAEQVARNFRNQQAAQLDQANTETAQTGGQFSQLRNDELQTLARNTTSPQEHTAALDALAARMNASATSPEAATIKQALKASTAEVLSPDQLPSMTESGGKVISTQEVKAAQVIAKLLGKRVVLYQAKDQSGKLITTGGFVAGDKKTAYINAHAKDSLIALTGHELAHLIEADHPDAFQAILDVAKQYFDADPEAAVKFRHYYGVALNQSEAKGFWAQDQTSGVDRSYDVLSDRLSSAGEIEKAWLSEAVADMVGNRFQEQTFWGDVFAEIEQKNTSSFQVIIQKLSDAIQKMLQKILATVMGRPGFTEFITDIRGVRAAIQAATVEAIQATRQTEATAAPIDMRSQSAAEKFPYEKPAPKSATSAAEPVTQAADQGVPVDEAIRRLEAHLADAKKQKLAQEFESAKKQVEPKQPSKLQEEIDRAREPKDYVTTKAARDETIGAKAQPNPAMANALQSAGGAQQTETKKSNLANALRERIQPEPIATSIPAKYSKQVNPNRDDILTAVAKLGGLDRRSAESEGVDKAHFNDRRGFGLPIFKKAGSSFDAMAEKLMEHGYLPADYTANELLDKVTTALSGKFVGTAEGYANQAETREIQRALERNEDIARFRTLPDSAFLADTTEVTKLLTERMLYAVREGISPSAIMALIDENDTAADVFAKLNDAIQAGPTAGQSIAEGEPSPSDQNADIAFPATGQGNPEPAGALARFSTDRNQEYAGYERNTGTVLESRDRAQSSEAQSDLFAPRDVPADTAITQAKDNFFVRYQQIKSRTFPSGLKTVLTPEDAAHVFAPLRKQAQENFLVLVTDKNGTIVNLIHHTKGLKDQSSASALEVAGAIASTPGAQNVWFSHNHPSGDPRPSQADYVITTRLASALDGMNLDYQGHIVIGENGKAVLFGESGAAHPLTTRPLPRSKTIDITERVLRKRNTNELPTLSAPSDAMKIGTQIADNSLLLLNNKNHPVGVITMSPAEMQSLRDGDRVRRLLGAIDQTNANGGVLYTSDDAAAKNIGAFLGSHSDFRLLDRIYKTDTGELRSAANNLEPVNTGAGEPFFSTDRSTYTDEQKKHITNVFGQPKTAREKFDAFRAHWQKNVIQGIFSQFEPIKELTNDGYMLARMSRGGDSTLEAMLLYGKVTVDKDGFYTTDYMKDKGFEGFAAKVLVPLGNEADRFLQWVSALRADRLKSVGLENLFSDDDIKVLKTLNQDKMDDGRSREVVYAKALADLNDFNDSVLKIAVDSGLVDESARTMFKDMPYIPFYRLADEEIAGPGLSGGLVNKSAWKRLKGGTEKLNSDLLVNTLLNWSHLITASAQNRAAKATLDAAVKAGVADEIPRGTPGKGYVKYKESGVDRVFAVSDPHLMDAITSLEYAGLGAWSKPFSKMKRLLTLGVTVNPAFKIRNTIRDTITAIGLSDLSYNPAENLRKGWSATAHDSEIRAKMMAAGGVLRFGSLLDGNTSAGARAMVERLGGDMVIDSHDGLLKLWDSKIKPAFDAYQEFGDRGENVNRAALYQNLMEKGMSHGEAAFWARDLMDFSNSGKWAAVRVLTQMVPFMNARLQGLYKLGKEGFDNPARLGYVVGAVSLASMGLMLAYNDDEDWKKRKDYDRQNYWWFKIGNTAIRIPKPFEIGAIGTIAEQGLEMFAADDMSGKRFIKNMQELVSNQLSMNPIPQLVKPMLDVYANKDSFTQAPIESMAMQRLLPKDRYNDRTSELARALGQLGLPDPAQLIGQGNYSPLSPVQIDSLTKGYFGWLGTMASVALDYGLRPIMDRGERPAMQLKDVFIAGNFVESLPSNSSWFVDRMYEQATEIEQAYASYHDALKRGDVVGAAELRNDHPEIGQYKAVERIKRDESKLNAQVKQIEASKSLSADTKRNMLNQLYQQRDRLARLIAP